MIEPVINYSIEVENIARDFANAQVPTSMDIYSRGTQSNKEKVREDIITGKLGEYCVYKYFRDVLKQPITEPDLNIYRGNKNWNPDMMSSNTPIHVKSCIEYDDYKNSWIIQDSLLRRDPVLDATDSSIMIFVSVCRFERWGEICGAVKVTNLRERNLFKAPRLERLIKEKKAVYAQDVISLPEYMRWEGIINGNL